MNSVDLYYRPFSDGLAWLQGLTPSGCLVVGVLEEETISELAKLNCELRSTNAKGMRRLVHDGLYAIELRGEWMALVVRGGRPQCEADSGRRRHMTDNHLIIAHAIVEDHWDDAQPMSLGAGLSVGDIVRRVGTDEVGQVKEVRRTLAGFEYTIVIDGQPSYFGENSLEKIEGDPRDPTFWLRQHPAAASDVALTLTWTKLRHPLTNTLYSYASSKTIFRAYQFKPVLKVLTSSSGRLLIADEVGLGKTIEAGLIWSELEQRESLDRALVVCPASLTGKWRYEMERRFDRRLDHLRPVELLERLQSTAHPEVHAVVSLESLRRATDVLVELSSIAPRLDLVIVDEAHYLRNRETKSYDMGRLLADLADCLIFLSATPLNLGENDLFNLVNMLSEGEFADHSMFYAQIEPNRMLNGVAAEIAGHGREEPRKLAARLKQVRDMRLGSAVANRPDFQILTRLLDVDRPLTISEVAQAKSLLAELNTLGSVLSRTRKVDVPDAKAVRVPVTVKVDWTEEEQSFYRLVFNAFMARARYLGHPPGFAMQMPLRQAASCIPAMQELLRERNDIHVYAEEIDDLDEDEDVDYGYLRVTERLLVPLPVDTKFERLMENLKDARSKGLRQFMIFSFFRRTLSYLHSRLSGEFSCRVMHGGVKMADRQRIIDDFRAGEFEVLLVSEVGSEGLDFEFCNVLVNYDLPWNPMRVEQRIGRLDRFGQEHEKIFVYNMHVPGTIETDIFQRLYDRIHIFERSIGELEPILRDELGDVAQKILDPKLSEEQRAQQVERIAVAVEHRARQLEQIKESRALLAGLDQLLVEGLSDEGPTSGRYVGQAEIRALLERLFTLRGGSLMPPNKNKIAMLVGTPELAREVQRSNSPRRGSKYSKAELAARLRDGEHIPVTFDTEVASKRDVELLSSRHPLVHVALTVMESESLTLKRFGQVGLPGLPAGRSLLIVIDLVETAGLRTTAELWATAVDVSSGEVDDEAGELLLTALAEGKLRDSAVAVPGKVDRLLRVAREAAAARRSREETTRRQDNEALVEGRIQAQVGAVQAKIRKAQELIEKLDWADGNEAVIRMHKGRLRNLRLAAENIRATLEPRKQLSMRVTPIAVVVATGPL